MLVESAPIEEILFDQLAMESTYYDQLNNICFPAECFPAKLDELVVKNIPGHFPNVNWDIIPSEADIMNDLLNEELEIAVTPFGNADSPVGEMFAKPHTITRPLSWLIHKIEHPDSKQYYFQSQDDNLSHFHSSIPGSLPLSESKFLGPQEAANLWIGTRGTTSRLHNDNYDNIYIQVAGTKRIYLLPPSSTSIVNERLLTPATYNEKMELIRDEHDERPVLFPTYDPSSEPPTRHTFVVELNPGDILFIPALWYHQVEITSDAANISLNYWHTPFDDERRWSAWNMSRQLARYLKDNKETP